MRHTVLGIESSICKALATELLKDPHNLVRVVNDQEYWIPETETLALDLTSVEDIRRGISGSDFVYLFTPQSPMDKTLRKNWPWIVKSVVNACKWNDSVMVYVDNADVYGRYNGRIVETTPCRPCNDTGKVMLEALDIIQQEMANGSLKCILARTSDVYGPYTTFDNYLNYNVIRRILKNEIPRWYIDAEVSHTFTFVNDIARSLILLIPDQKNYNQLWHLPTAYPLSGQTFIHLTANVVGIDTAYNVLSGFSLWFYTVMNRNTSLHSDRLYRFDNGICFDSSKFNKTFMYEPVSYYDGIQQTVDYLLGW